ncbi:hypothetical protein [Pseudonocardia alni]|uniref:hypothetical protein n=1 Tax=Pseudonocardia alni TaxID=33907 RepID=UPI0027AA7BBE|nr:hypothetical protein PaSha_23625 [Pseudonocardia alni]
MKKPDTFRYRSTASQFSVWGYDLSVGRSTVEFLDLNDARSDGRSFQLRGSGAVRILTPPTLEAGKSYQVATTADDGTTSASSIVADSDGRLPILVDLGRGQLSNQVLEPTGASPARSMTVEVS